MSKKINANAAGSVGTVLLEELLGLQRPRVTSLEPLIARSLAGDIAAKGGIATCQRCGEVFQGSSSVHTCCETCSRRRGIPDMLVALGDYTAGLGILLSAAKYGRWPEVLGPLGRRLGDALLAEFGHRTQEPPLLVPMPAPWIRKWHRGIDHARELANAVGEVTQWDVLPLLRRGFEPTQVGRSRTQRQRGVRGLMPRLFGASRMCGRRVFLIDDVRTSGTSLAKASRLCRRLGATQVVAGVVAVRRESHKKQETSPRSEHAPPRRA